MTSERRAVLLLLGLAVGGQALRVWLGRPSAAPGAVTLLPAAVGGGSAALAHRDSGIALGRPLRPGETIDLDRAPALEIARLPRIGLHLAKTIVADREARGPFGSLERLDRVAGVGAGLLTAIREHAAFSLQARPPDVVEDTAGAGRPPPDLSPRPIDLNHASAEELQRLPRIGPSLAARIVAFRQSHGPFPSVDSLVRVPGIGPATLARLRERLTVQ